MKIFFVIASLIIPTFLFSQNETKTENRVKENLKINKVKSRITFTSVSKLKAPFDSCNFDNHGNVISSKYFYDSSGQLTKEYHCDSCRILFWTYQYENGKIISWSGFGHDSLLISSTTYEYDSLGRLSKYYSYRKDKQAYTSSIVSGDSTFYIDDTFYKDVFDTIMYNYVGDTIKYYSSNNPKPEVLVEHYNKNGFITEYNEIRNNLVVFKTTYEYDVNGNLICKQSYNSSGKLYLKYLYFYDKRNLVYKMEYYQSDLTKPATTYSYEYITE